MNNILRKMLCIFSCLLLSYAAWAETDQDRLRATGMFDNSELSSFPANYAVVEFRFSEDQFPAADQIPLMPDFPGGSSSGNLLYLGVWGNKFSDFDAQRTTDNLSSHMHNAGKRPQYYKMDLHSPTAAENEQDTWNMTTIFSGTRSRSLAEKNRENSAPALIPLPFPYRAVRTGQLSCTARMIAAADPDQIYTLTITHNGNPLQDGILKNRPNHSISFPIEPGTQYYVLQLKKGRHTSAPIFHNTWTYSLPQALQGQGGWLPIPISQGPFPEKTTWNPSTTVYQQFKGNIPVMFPAELKRGEVYWLFLRDNKVTLDYDFVKEAKLELSGLSRGWHFIATGAYQLDSSILLQAIQAGQVSPEINFFDIETQKYQKWDSSQPLPDCLFLFKN